MCLGWKIFVAYVDIGKEKKAFKIFEVPDYFITAEKEKGTSESSAAGWWYMNKIDCTSCINDFEWCIIPFDRFEEMLASMYRDKGNVS